MPETQEALEHLLEVGRLLSSKLDLSDLLQSVLGLASRVVDAESASLLLLDERAKELYFEEALGLGEAASKVRLKLGEGIAGAVALSLQPEIINDVRGDRRWSPQTDAVSGFTTRSILAVPMRVKGKLIGVVEAINKRGGGFSAQDLRTFEGFAAQAAVAIENARLFSSLRDERLKLKTIFSEMTDAAVLTSPDGVIELANPAARKLLALDDGGGSLDAAFSSFLMIPPLGAVLASDADGDFEAARAKPTRLMLAGRATRVEAGWLLVMRDVTEAWRRDRLQRSFLSLISHKLKTPLASVLGYSDLLREEAAAPPVRPMMAKAAESVSTQGRKLSDLVDKLLRYATLANDQAAFDLAPCPLDPVVEETVRGMKDWLKENDAVVLHEAGTPVVARGDREKLGEALKALIENAVKFDLKPKKKVAVWAERAGGEALLTVKDEGPGIPPEELERVFQSFHQIETYFTGQIDGWGLGLPYVKRILEAHRGRVELRSKLGEGTTVTLRLPL